MNPYVSANWLEIAFPIAMSAIVGGQFWRRRPSRKNFLYTIGVLALVLAFTGAVVANLFYQRALSARAWPTTGIFDQVIATPTNGVFVKVRDPIMGRAERVQRYSCQGKFEAAFQPDSAGGAFKIAVNQDRTISIYSVKTETIDTFGFAGNFLQRFEVGSSEMPFDFFEEGPSVTTADGCDFAIDSDSGVPAIKNGGRTWPLEDGDWVLEHLLGRSAIITVALLGGLMLLVSYIKLTARQGIASSA